MARADGPRDRRRPLATAPLVAIHFGVLPVTGGVVNLACALTTAVLLPASLAGTLLLPFWPVSRPAAAVAGAASRSFRPRASFRCAGGVIAVTADGDRGRGVDRCRPLLRGRLRLAAIAAALALVVGAGAAARAWRSGAVTFVDAATRRDLVELPRGRAAG